MNTTFKKLPPERQIQILQAAASVFAEKGYYQANIASICQRAEISNGALYKYFKNKENLYIYVYNYICETMFNGVYDFNPPEEKSVYDIITDMMLDNERYFHAHPSFMQLYADIWSTSMNQFASKVSMQMEAEIDNYWIKLAKRGLKRGEIDPAFSPEYAAYLIDSQTILFFFSLTSVYHQKRFDVFLRAEQGNLCSKKLINKMVENIRLCLAPRHKG